MLSSNFRECYQASLSWKILYIYILWNNYHLWGNNLWWISRFQAILKLINFGICKLKYPKKMSISGGQRFPTSYGPGECFWMLDKWIYWNNQRIYLVFTITMISRTSGRKDNVCTLHYSKTEAFIRTKINKFTYVIKLTEKVAQRLNTSSKSKLITLVINTWTLLRVFYISQV